MHKKLIYAFISLIIWISPAAADICRPLTRYDIHSFEAGKWLKPFYDHDLLDSFYYLNTFDNLQAQPYCWYEDSILGQHLDVMRENEAFFVFRSIGSRVGNKLLRSTGINNFLYLQLTFDFSPSDASAPKSKEGEEALTTEEYTKFRKFVYDANTASTHFFDKVKKFAPEEEVRAKLLLGERIRLGISYSGHYVEPSYDIVENRLGLSYSNLLQTRNYELGIFTLEYIFPQQSFSIVDGYVQARYSFIF